MCSCLYASTDCFFPSLCLASCADIPLLNFLADSLIRHEYDDLEMYASFAKFNKPDKAWCLEGKDSSKAFMQIDFRFLHKICAVGTMGKDGKFVDRYYVSYSKNGKSYSDVSLFGTRFVSIPVIDTFHIYYFKNITTLKLKSSPFSASGAGCSKAD